MLSGTLWKFFARVPLCVEQSLIIRTVAVNRLNGESLLEGKTVNLRVVEKEDLPLIVEWANDPEFNGEHEPIMQLSKTDLEKWYVNSGPEEKWFLVEKKDKARIGLVRYDSQAWGTTLGSVLIPSERGKGYCTEAVRMLVDYLFLSKDIVRIQARFNKHNVASMRVLEKVGFTKEGTMRKSSFSRGKWVDMVVTSILREEWKDPKILTETKKE